MAKGCKRMLFLLVSICYLSDRQKSDYNLFFSVINVIQYFNDNLKVCVPFQSEIDSDPKFWDSNWATVARRAWWLSCKSGLKYIINNFYLSLKISTFILCVCVFACMYVCVQTTCMSDVLRGQKKALNALEPELQVAVIHHEGAGNRTQAFYKSNQCF